MPLIISENILFVLLAYVLGSIPTAVWVGRMFYGIDVRTQGSKSAGATNTIRVLGLKAGIPVLVIDALKGTVAVLIGGLSAYPFNAEQAAFFYVLLAMAAVIGHVFPVFAKFKGGKGVATLLGIAVALFPYEVLILIALFVVVFMLTRYVSLGSMSAAICFPFLSIFVFGNTEWAYVAFSITVAIFVPLTHIKNIKRLVKGKENKMYFTKK